MGKERPVERVYHVTVDDNKERERPQRRWRDEVKELLMWCGRG